LKLARAREVAAEEVNLESATPVGSSSGGNGAICPRVLLQQGNSWRKRACIQIAW